jgi:aspartyl protease family protein
LLHNLRKDVAMRAFRYVWFLLLPSIAFSGAFKCVENGHTIYSETACGADAQQVPERIGGLAHPVSVDGTSRSVTLMLNNHGAYTISGTVNDASVEFQVDTGASMVTVARRIAERAGIPCERQTVSQTANGPVRGCVATVSEITFGGFRMNNIQVGIVPNMAVDALLGMNALRYFKIDQPQDGIMIISTK